MVSNLNKMEGAEGAEGAEAAPPAQPAERDTRVDLTIAAALVALATGLRLGWVLAVPTVPVSDFAMYRESANYLSEFGSLDHGFIYMPGFVVLLAWVKDLGGELLAQKMLGVFFGGLGAAGVYAVARALLDRPTAVIATVLYALWPAGVAMSSVVGTDVPAAALLMAALGCLVVLAPRRPWMAAVLFGVVMGLAAWVRAVALPLTALSAGFWLARRTPLRRTAGLTAAAVGATLLVLSPWAIRHLRQTGTLYFTDDHGGITALIGANPNSEGTYTRALNQMFHDLTGHSVLDEPHRQVDQAAYALAREWTRFEPAYALGLAVGKAERLFDPEQRLLYWSVLRPGVLVGRAGDWFNRRREAIGDAADAFGLALMALALTGLAFAVAQRRWAALALVPFQLAMAATYTVFFAEPRYRLPIEMLAFPFVALALVALARAGTLAARRAWPEARRAAWPLGGAAVLIALWRLGWPAIVDGGAGLRARHRWAATVWAVDGRARLCKWRPAPPLRASSPVEGAPSGVRLRADGAHATAAVVELGGGPLPAGPYTLVVRVDASGTAPLHLALSSDSGDRAAVIAAPAVPATLHATVHHAGGPLRLTATLDGAAPGSVWLSQPSLDAAGAR